MKLKTWAELSLTSCCLCYNKNAAAAAAVHGAADAAVHGGAAASNKVQSQSAHAGMLQVCTG